MIKAIIWDWCGVMATNDIKGASRKLSEQLGIPFEAVEEILVDYAWSMEATPEYEEYLEGLAKRLKISVDEIKDALNNHPPNEVYEFAKSLKGKYKQYVLSNQLRFRSDYIKANMDLSFFDDVFFSNEIGHIKPSREAFDFVLKAIGLKAEECVFVDDWKKNIEAAKELGFKVILFTNLDSLKEELEQIL